MLKINPKELNSICNLKIEERYEYFIKKICDQEEVCVLKSDKETFFIDKTSGVDIVHLWSAEEFAKKYIEINNLETNAITIDFDELGNKLYPFIISNNLLLSIMPIYEMNGLCVEVNKFSNDLKVYLDEWYN